MSTARSKSRTGTDGGRRERQRRARELSPDVSFGSAYDPRLLKRLWVFVRPERGLLTLALLSYPLASIFHLAQPYLVKVAIDQHIVPRRLDGFDLLVLVFIGVILLEFVARYYQTLLTQLLGQRVTKELRTALFAQLQKVDLAFLERNPVGRLMTRVTNDVESIAEMFSAGAITILGDIVTLVGIVVMMLILDWKLTLFAFAVLPILLAVVLLFRGPAREAFREVRTHLARINGFLNEAISGMALIQVFRQEREMRAEFEEVNASYRDATFQAIRYDAMTYAIIEGIATVATALILFFGFGFGAGVDGTGTKIGVFVAFIDYLRRFFAPITELSTKYTILQSAMASAERCIDLLDESPSVVDPEAPRAVGPIRESLSFNDVTFAYGRNAPIALAGLSLSVGRGEKVAIVGPTGAGKSTIVKLVARFYDPIQGSITIDGVDIRAIGVEALRSKLAVVLQDAYLFDGTIRENIAFGSEKIDDARLEDAALRTQALDVIRQLPEGWQSNVGERGSRLSSGERQLVAFARALALDPEILVLDEATSAVDPETEARIQKGLEALIQERTAVIIAHRLSTIRKVDRIIVLASGRVVEQGSHDQLIARGGLYRTLYELQFSENVDAASPSPSPSSLRQTA